MLATAASPITAAAMARPISNPLTPRRTGAGAIAGRAIPDAVAGAAAIAGLGAELVAGAAVAGRAVGGPAGAAVAGRGEAGGGPGVAVAGAPGAPVAGSEGSLMVAVAGLGGRLIRTVSFFGCTFAGSGGFGGTAPAGILGLLSAIVNCQLMHTKIASAECQTLIGLCHSPGGLCKCPLFDWPAPAFTAARASHPGPRGPDSRRRLRAAPALLWGGRC
jgi:hypothetical protein